MCCVVVSAVPMATADRVSRGRCWRGPWWTLATLLAALAVSVTVSAADSKAAEQSTDIPDLSGGAAPSESEPAASEKKEVVVDSENGDDDDPEPAEYREFQQVGRAG